MELVPYRGKANRISTSPSSSSSVGIDAGPPTEDEDSNENECLTSDAEISVMETVINKSTPLATLVRNQMIKELDPACIKDILKDHELNPPQHKEGDREDIPATQEKLNYFHKMLQLKTSKYSKLEECNIPHVLRNVPLALSYKYFITMYWPGAMICCQKLYKSTQTYGSHFYKFHKTPTPSFALACVAPSVPKNSGHGNDIYQTTDAESDSDIVILPHQSSKKRLNSSLPLQQNNLPKRQVGRPSPSNDNGKPNSSNENSTTRKRKSLSPASRPGPLRHKQAKLNQTISVVDFSLDSGDEKNSGRPKRNLKTRLSQDNAKKKNEEWEDELNADQIKYQPQHEPGAPENFLATAQRIKYFSEVLSVKFSKYGQLNNSNRSTSPSHQIPLALGLNGFMQYYWPGKLMCCGVTRENLNSLERHIARTHRPPKSPPTLSLISSSPPTPPASDNSEAASVSHASIATKPSTSESSKYPAGFEKDQNQFLPQHIPGDPEDFLANQYSIDYFIQTLSVKWEKYSHLAPLKGLPLSSAYSEFVLNYWPGMMSCCDKVYTTCKEFELHLTTTHLPSKKIPQLCVVDQSDIPPQVPKPSVPTPEPYSPQSYRPLSKNHSRLAIESAPSLNDQTSPFSIFNTPAHLLRINAIHSEASQLRKQTTQSMTINEVLPLLERLLELSSSIVTGIRGSMEVEARSRAVESLEYVWNASKMAIVRWEDIKGSTSRDPYLKAIQYAYGTLPVFTNWEQNKHLEMLESVILLSSSAVKNWEPPASSPEKKPVRPAARRRTVKQMRTEATAADPTPSSSSTAADVPKATGKNLEEVKEFCRLANISIWQNTKGRALTGHLDDEGNSHAMYRYGIAQILKLYCPPGVTHLKCCNEEFDLTNLRVHVTKFHEGFRSDRTAPSISPV